jgi:hypothetical protein
MNDLNRRVTRHAEELREIQNKSARSEVYNWDNQDKFTMAAASNLAQSIDRDVMRELSKSTAMQINGGKWPKGTLK